MERKLKDSGIPWIGEIPEHWDVMRLRRVFSEAHEKTTDEEGQLLTLSQYTGISPKSEGKRVGMFEAESTVGYNIVHVGQFVMNIMLAWNGSYGVSDFEGIISPAYVVFNFNFRCCKKYFHYLLRLDGYPPAFKTVSRGIIESRLRLYPIYFYQFLTIVPPLAEQEAIAAYLDAKCGEIDELIEVEQQMISDLESYRQSVITEAVTHGLNPDVPSKDSGNDWIGYIPEHWETIPVQHFFEFRNGYTPSKANASFWTNGIIPWFRMEDIRKSGRYLKESLQYITPEAMNNGGTFEAGSFILAICTASIGEHALLIADSLANQRFTNLKIRKSLSYRIETKYIFYYMFILGRFCKDTSIVTTFPYADITRVKNFIVPTPPLTEQQEIAAYIDKKCAEIDELIKVKQEKIETLKRYRQSLIFEAVTGKTPIIENL